MWHLRSIPACLFFLAFLSCSPAGEQTARVSFEEKWSCFNGCHIILSQGKYGLVDEAGLELLPASFDAIEFLDEDIALASREGRAFLCDRKGRILSPEGPPDSLRLNYTGIAARVLEEDRQRWEKVVEDYAALCKACKSAQGRRLPRKEFASLKAHALLVRESLEAATGQPTPSQKARLEVLSNDYRRAFQ